MNYCDFEETTVGWKCVRCGNLVPQKAEGYHCPIPKTDDDTTPMSPFHMRCGYMGNDTDEYVTCEGCGNPKYTLFECSLHGLCQPYITKHRVRHAERDDFQLCRECDDYVED